ncbi:SGNH hydrolase domain-containing protein [Nesterenkonia sandarakina]|uniref:Peptidoglycan/LPS O-acetylase OafA/YrhL n=1 Tax=Nesterenkonia sandarakina TaxID=272918 RepID=A0A7Z0J4A7_9MICC|nr:peptidoglycan/LPS O-acetylase OafA/YrhL [Nesterenkonia sandarakina]
MERQPDLPQAAQARPSATDQRLTHNLPERRYRPELHGVRGLAILGVVLFHLFGAGRVSGGIDIFLAVSGFLFTGMLLRESAVGAGPINIVRYLARIARRLLPAAAMVIATTLAVGLYLFPSTRHEQLWTEARASFLYFENIELINSQLAYGAAGLGTSPFQHFWSLSVQGQFYLVWPVVAVVSVLLARRLRRPAAHVMTLLVILIIAASFVFTLYMQTMDQDQAYLMTRTRFWELAFGGLLALVASSIALPSRLRFLAGWMGVGLIVTCGFLLDGASLFPGPWALWPLAGLTLVMLSANSGLGLNESRASAAAFLSHGFFAWIGNVAYGLYLWHWPLLIFYLEAQDREAIDVQGAAAVFAVSLLLAWVTYRWVEQPMNRTKVGVKAQLAATAAVLTVVGIASSLVMTQLAPAIPEGYAMTGVDRSAYPGAAALEGGQRLNDDGDVFPEPHELGASEPMFATWGCEQTNLDEPGSDEVLVCEDPDPPAEPAATIMLTGGSHSAHWYNALALLAEEHHWELIVANKSGCRLRDAEDEDRDNCVRWNENLPSVVTEYRPDVVISTGTALYRSGSEEQITPGAENRWHEIVETGAELLLIRGTARPDENVPDCLAAGGTSESCGVDHSIYAEQDLLAEITRTESIYSIDMTDYICPEGACPAVIGNVGVYRDDSHLSSHYVETLAPYLDERIRAELPHLYR